MTDMNKAVADMEALFVQAGKARAKAEQMDERRKRIRATLFVKYRGDGKGSAESEQFAMADPLYEAACTDRDMAAFDAEELRAKMEARKLSFEAWRTANATRRAQMNLR